ncbi:MAG: dTDP-4-dehydrorhamnose reductase [Betaproteobacteria bacterium]|nr:MAG: dTDP-4-dehydrorhamnose reductase [Betaproteobacteria bacterium]
MILLTGGNGQVGWELQRTLACLGEVMAVGRERLDLSRPERVRAAVLNLRPRWIVNAAAYTAVDRAETERELAYAVNAESPRVLAEVAAEIGATLLHYSTDYVLDGAGDQPFVEASTVGALNVYGASKAAGEAAIQASGAQHLILRTSWVYGARGANFLLTMQRLLRERPELRIVDDQIGAPTWSRHIAEATALVLAQIASPSRGADRPSPWGLYHLTNAGETSWFGFAEAIRAGLTPPDALARLIAIPSSAYPTVAQRPLNSRLSNAKLARVFGLRLPDWRVALNHALG